MTTPLTVTKNSPELITPADPTPTCHLPLSYLDRLPGLNFFVEMVFVFRHGVAPAEAIRKAVAKVLVPYYPVAGRMTSETDDGKMQVNCNGEGLWFVEAKAECRLEDVDWLQQQPLRIPKEELLPAVPAGVDHNGVPFMVQVTEFKCGGFAIGFKSSHRMFDGIGAGQFKVAIGEMARGLPAPTLKPVWCREAIPSPYDFPDIELTFSTTFLPEFVHYTIDFDLDNLSKMQSKVAGETGQWCSVFDVVAATLWQSRTRAVALPAQTNVTLTFPVNARQELRKELPSEGIYYGNCIFQVVIKASSERIANASLAEIIMLIKDEKRSISEKLSKFLRGEMDDVDPEMLAFTYGTTNLTDARRVGLTEADYGWGPPAYVVPLMDNPLNMSIFLNAPAPKMGIRLITHCVMKEHLEGFQEELKSLS